MVDPRSKKEPSEIDRRVSQRLRQRREARGLTQADLANALGVTFQQVQKYENGKNRMTSGRLRQAAQFLKVPVAYFYNEASAAEPSPDPEEVRLLRAFTTISDPTARLRIVELVEAAAASRVQRQAS